MVVEDDRRALGEVERVGQGKGHVGGSDRPLGHAAQAGEGHHAIASLQAAGGGRGDDRAADLRPGNEGQVGFELVEPARLQNLREGHAGGGDVDQHPLAGREHVVGLRLGHIHDAHAVGPAELADLDGEHRAGG